MSDTKQTMLLVKLTSMGDVIHTLPAITDLMKTNPNLELSWAIDPNLAEIASWHPFVKNIIPIPIRQWRKTGWIKSIRSGEIKKTIKQLKDKHYDNILDAQGLIKSALTAFNAHGPRSGYDKKSIKDPTACLFYDNKYKVSKDLHAVERIRQLFAAHFKYDLKTLALDYGLKDSFLSDKFTWPKIITKPKQPYIVCLHGTTWNSKLWPEQHWIKFILDAINQGYAIKITSGDAEEFNRATNIKIKTKAILPDANIQVLPRLQIDEVAIMLAHAKASVAVDTGFGHLAAALNTPQVSIYGATNAQLTKTYGLNQYYIQSDIDCSPCMRRECLNPKFKELNYPPCYEKITAKKVLANLDKLIKGRLD